MLVMVDLACVNSFHMIRLPYIGSCFSTFEYLNVLLIAPINLCALLTVVCISSEKDRRLSIITPKIFF